MGLALLASSVILFPLSAQAANLITNGSFEEGNFTGFSFTRLSSGSTDIVSWTVGGPTGIDWHDSFEFQFPIDGDKVVDLNLDGGGINNTGSISQSFSTTPGTQYQLSFFLSGPGSNFGFPDPRQVQVNVAGIEQVFSAPASLNTDLVWEAQNLEFTAIASSTTLTFSSVNGSGFWGPLIDDVSVVQQPVPEPLTLLGASAAVAFGAAFKRRRRA